MKFWRIIAAVILCSVFVAGQTKMVSVGPGVSQSDRVAGTITTNTSVVSAVTTGWTVSSVTISGTYAGVTINFETTDDNTNWYPTTCTRTDTPTQEISEAVATNATRSWDCGIYGTTSFRVRASAYGSGTGNVGITLSGAHIEPSPTVSGTVTAAGNNAAGTLQPLLADVKGLNVHGSTGGFTCVVPVSTATTVQAVGGSCIAPGAGLSLYITDIAFGTSAAAGTAADSFPTIKSGTGGTCGAATTVIWQALTTANSTIVENRSTPIKVTANNEICWIMTTAGSKVLQVSGFIAP